MLIPNKYEDTSKNLLAVAGQVITSVRGRKNLYSLYKKVIEQRKDEYPITFSKYLLALDFLYAIGKIDIEDKDVIKK